jgi:flagellar basal-body rod protein FlgG
MELLFGGGAVNIGKITPGVFVDTVFVNYSPGSLTNTDNPLDLAIQGEGFFTVNVNGQEMYTRDGSFTLLNGRLVTHDGSPVLGRNGAIDLPNGEITIDEWGNIFVNAELIDTFRLTDFEDKSTLRSAKDNMFAITEDSVARAAEGTIKQGVIENSNVNSAREMIEMININRTYEASQRSIMTIDQTLQRAVNDIANRR